MRKIKLLFLLLLILGFVNSLPAQQVYYAGIPTEKFNYYAATQQDSQWCWAASIQMIFNYYGINITQKEIVTRSYGTDENGKPPDLPGSFEIITSNLNNWNIDNSGTPYVVQASLYWGAPTPAYLVQELAAQHPILIGYMSGMNSGHAVVITACSYIPTVYGPYIQTIVVRDPWPNAQNKKNLGRIEYSGINLASVIMAHWFIRIYQ